MISSSVTQAKTPLGGKARRRKGAEGEREFFRLLSDWLGEDVHRSLSAARSGGADNEVGGILGRWAIEVKRQDSPKIATWWTQAVTQSPLFAIPALAYRLPRCAWRVRVPIETLDFSEDAPLLPTWNLGVEWTAEVSVEVFAYIVRERK